MNKKWGTLVPVENGTREKGRRGTRGFGGSLTTTTKRGREESKGLGQLSLAFMTFFVGSLWTALLIDGSAVADSVGRISFVGLFFAAVGHMLLILCDSLSGGNAREALWAIWIFWGGILLSPFVLGLVCLL